MPSAGKVWRVPAVSAVLACESPWRKPHPIPSVASASRVFLTLLCAPSGTARSFLPDHLRQQITTLTDYPVVNRAGESAVPGLYFAGAPAAVSLGPSVRFVAGTHNLAAPLARAVARRAKATKGKNLPAMSSQADQSKQATAV
jgi:hypothetical protein